MIRRIFSTLIEQSTTTFSDFSLPPANILSNTFPQQLQTLSWLQEIAPCFPVCGDRVTVIQDPNVFYNTILSKCASARTRISLTSLYFGIGDLENNLLFTLQENMRNNRKLKVNILLDFARGTRGKENSKTMIMPLVQENENIKLSMFHTPALRGFRKRFAPPRFNELIGLQHMKVYLFDNSVIISGANLSNDYFANRQDRYIMIENKPLADFYAGLVEKVQEFSLQVTKDADFRLHDSWLYCPYDASQTTFMQEARKKIYTYFKDAVDMEKRSKSGSEKLEADTWIFPVVEMGQLGIHHDSVVTKAIFRNAQKGSRIQMATGYFNLTQEYMESILECSAQCSILMAHPNANSFKGVKGPAGGIPAAYTLIAKQFYEKIIQRSQQNRIELFEYEQKEWTYHAKGLWYYLPRSKHPSLTLIGSSNFGERSVNRDLETQLCIVTSNPILQRDLHNECENLYTFGKAAEREISNRVIPYWVRVVVSIFRNFF
ncbi:CDP-diacylglycerol--glycerol-3-phosphate 3-phosphatidyltransferase [Sergentomyia squamirostris]